MAKGYWIGRVDVKNEEGFRPYVAANAAIFKKFGGHIAFSEGVAKYLDHLRTQGLIESWRLTRRKLGFGHAELGDFHLMIEVKDMTQLDRAFDHVAERSEPTESFHFGVNSLVQNVRFALYRDFPDPQRQRGAERF
jgi:hypothetical protein